MKKIVGAIAMAGGLLAASTAVAEEVLRAVTSLPTNNVTTRRFNDFADLVNETGAGVVRIEIIGGPEAIPPDQQDTALRNGIVDIQTGPATYYAGVVPESQAMVGSTISAAESRENGSFDMLREAWRERLGAELISWIGAETDYYIFLRELPKLDADGNLVAEGLKLRSVPTYRDWFDALGAENVMMQQSEIFSALERGIVDGFGWISIVSDVGVNRLLKARVGPPVWNASAVIMANGRRFDALPDEAKKVLSEAAMQIEATIAKEASGEVAEDEEKLKAAGVELVTLEGEAGRKHVDKAHNVVWAALEVNHPEFTAKIKPLLYPAD